MVLKRDPFHEDSKYVLGFEMGQRESGFDSERTESQTDVTSSMVLVYRFTLIGASFARILWGDAHPILLSYEKHSFHKNILFLELAIPYFLTSVVNHHVYMIRSIFIETHVFVNKQTNLWAWNWSVQIQHRVWRPKTNVNNWVLNLVPSVFVVFFLVYLIFCCVLFVYLICIPT